MKRGERRYGAKRLSGVRGQFDERSALCENWRRPERRFGCAHCGTFYGRRLYTPKREQWLTVILTTLVMLTATMLLGSGMRSGDTLVTLFSRVICVPGLLALVLRNPVQKQELTSTGYRTRLPLEPQSVPATRPHVVS